MSCNWQQVDCASIQPVECAAAFPEAEQMLKVPSMHPATAVYAYVGYCVMRATSNTEF